MARPKKTVTKKTTKTKSTARGKAKTQTHDKAKMSSDLETQTAKKLTLWYIYPNIICLVNYSTIRVGK
jgi:hypothetical protein